MKTVLHQIKQYKTQLLFNLILVLFLLILLWIKPINNIRDYSIDRQNGDEDWYELVYANNSISQVFYNSREADSIELKLGVVNNSFHGHFIVSIYDADNELIYSWDKDKIEIVDNWVQFNGSNDMLHAQEFYLITITAPDQDISQAIRVYMCANPSSNDDSLIPAYTDGGCFLNLEELNGSACFAIYENKHNPFAIISLIICIFSANLWWLIKRKSHYLSLLTILISFSLIMYLIMAPASGPDDQYHYYSALQLSSIMLGEKNISSIPTEYLSTVGNHFNANSSYLKVINAFGNRASLCDSAPLFFNYEDLSHPLSHLAPAIGILICRVTHRNFISTYEMGRLFNMILYLAESALAIYIIPKRKELMLLICSMPMCVHQAVQFSYDATVNGLSFIFVAYIFRIIHDDIHMTWKYSALLFTILIGFAPIKVIYILLAFLVFMIPKKQYASKTLYWICNITILISSLLFVIICKWSSIHNSSFMGNDYRVKDLYSLQYGLSHPFSLLRITLNSIENELYSHILGSVGKYLGGLSIVVPDYIIILYILILLCVTFSGREEKMFLYQRIIAISVCSIGILSLYPLFFFVYTHYGAQTIGGVQGRYFIPFLFPLLFSLPKSGVEIKIQTDKLLLPIWFIQVALIVSVMNMIQY